MEVWVHRNGEYAGRFSESAIRDKIADGSFSPIDLAWNQSKAAWQPLSEFLAALPEPPKPRSGPLPLPIMPIPAAGPPPLPVMSVSPGPTPSAQAAAHQPPEGETIWSPY